MKDDDVLTCSATCQLNEDGTFAIRSEGRPQIPADAPPEFGGRAGTWCPAQLLLGALESCTMLTFMKLADKKGLPVKSYKISGSCNARMEGGKVEIENIDLLIEVSLPNEGFKDLAGECFDAAEAGCPIRKALSCTVTSAFVMTFENRPSCKCCGDAD